MFVGWHRIIESVVTLQFDRFLIPKPDQTIIYLGPIPKDNPLYGVDLFELYRGFGINTECFHLVLDPPVDPSANFRKFGDWIGQQFLKLMAIDACTDNEILLQDADTFAIKPYHYFKENETVTFVLQGETHSPEYYEYITKFLGIPRQNLDSFVTEFLPIKKSDWVSLRTQLEQIHHKGWMQSMIDQFSKDYQVTKSLWFAEFEMLGNWFMYKHPDMRTQFQLRYSLNDRSLGEYRKHGIIKQAMPFAHYNCFCMKIYDKQGQLTLDEVRPLVEYLNRCIQGNKRGYNNAEFNKLNK